MNVRETLDAAVQALMAGGADRDGARLDAELLMAQALGRERTWLFTWPEHELDDEARAAFTAALQGRLEGRPVAYLTGRRGFWTLELDVNDAVLIPRPETEHLVERALNRLPDRPGARAADLGTGSGAIALALASERTDAAIVATDICRAALEVATANRDRLGLTQVELLESDWCTALEGRFDVIVSNPPYVDGDDPHLQQGDLRFEPRDALTPGPDGLAAIRTITEQSPGHLVAGGWLMFEHGADQGDAVRGILETAGFQDVASHTDLAGRERVTEGRLG